MHLSSYLLDEFGQAPLRLSPLSRLPPAGANLICPKELFIGRVMRVWHRFFNQEPRPDILDALNRAHLLTYPCESNSARSDKKDLVKTKAARGLSSLRRFRYSLPAVAVTRHPKSQRTVTALQERARLLVGFYSTENRFSNGASAFIRVLADMRGNRHNG
jgi:hypothetical protein